MVGEKPMRPLLGVLLELVALAILLRIASSNASSDPSSVLGLLIAQALTTVLIHSPSHYLIGRALGIRFSKISLGRSTATKALPSSLKRASRFLFVPTLSVDRESRRTAPPRRMKAMFLAGISASAGSAIAFALAVSAMGNYLAALVTWPFALAYLASNLRFSPLIGDLMRARAAVTGK